MILVGGYLVSIDSNMDLQYQRYTLKPKLCDSVSAVRDVAIYRCGHVVGRKRPRSMSLSTLIIKMEKNGFLFLYVDVVLFLYLWCTA